MDQSLVLPAGYFVFYIRICEPATKKVMNYLGLQVNAISRVYGLNDKR